MKILHNLQILLDKQEPSDLKSILLVSTRLANAVYAAKKFRKEYEDKEVELNNEIKTSQSHEQSIMSYNEVWQKAVDLRLIPHTYLEGQSQQELIICLEELAAIRHFITERLS